MYRINLTTFSVTQTNSLHSTTYDHYSPTMPAFDPAQNVIVSHRRDTTGSSPAFMMWSFDELTGSLTQIGSYASASLGNRQVIYVGADETYIYFVDWGGTDFLRFTKIQLLGQAITMALAHLITNMVDYHFILKTHPKEKLCTSN